MFRTATFAGALLAIGLGLGPHCAQAQGFSFGLWGDMPYQKAGDQPKNPNVFSIQPVMVSSERFSPQAGGLSLPG